MGPVWLLLLVTLTTGQEDGRQFIGVGYNLLTGNPDGGDDVRGGVDPGLLYTRKILEIAPGPTPPQLVSERRQSCVKTQTIEVFYGAKSYQEKLGLGIKVAGGGLTGLLNFAFSLSPRFQKEQNSTNLQHNVYRDNVTVCNVGRTRYSEELEDSKGFTVTQSFAQAIIHLPLNYSRDAYMSFLDHWGTHVTIEIDLGTKVIERSRCTLSEFVEHVRKEGGFGLSLGGNYMGAEGSLAVDFNQFKVSNSFQTNFGNYEYTLQAGSQSLPESIGMTLVPIVEALRDELWTGLWAGLSGRAQPPSLAVWKAHLYQALSEYAAYKMAPPVTDPPLRIPVRWPRGTYGLMRAATGCPGGHVTWETGSRFEQTEVMFNHNQFSANLHLSGLFGHGQRIRLDYCIKGVDHISDFDLSWPPGDYCLLKYGNCPAGLSEGYIRWDDEDMFNKNGATGTLPDGKYNENTQTNYCCRNDRVPTDPIALPTEQPFYLLRYTRGCQHVAGMKVQEEWIQWDESDFFSVSASGGAHPFSDGSNHNHRLHFCYYTKDTSLPAVG